MRGLLLALLTPALTATAQGLDRASVASYAMMTTPDTLPNGTRLTYGFGLEVVQVSNHAAIMHGGSTPGFTSGSFVFPGDSLDIVLLSNSSVSPSSLALNIVRVLFDMPTSGRGGSRVSVPVAQPLTDADRDRLLGTYDFVPATGSAMVLRVALDEGKLIAQRDGADQRPLPLIHRGNLRFATLVDRAILLTFVEENGKITSLRFQQGAETLVGRRRP
jgi:CubicO group peptidase (beta-lactamase class C family)